MERQRSAPLLINRRFIEDNVSIWSSFLFVFRINKRLLAILVGSNAIIVTEDNFLHWLEVSP